MLRISELHHHYQGPETSVEVLRGLDFELKRGEFVALMGPSGCGKSTLLHLCGAMDRPTRGEIEFEGVSFASAADGVLTDLRCRKIGFIFQSFNLLPTLTVLENAALPLRFAGKAPAEARAAGASWLEKVGLSRRAGHFPSQLSGGEKQRAAIARALVASPSLIIADEPTGSLDSENGRNVTALLSKMHQDHGIAILMATHDASVAAAAQRIVYMKDGQISQPT